MDRIFAWLEWFLKILAATLGSLIIIVAFMQVVSRYVLMHAFTWPEEICGFLFMWCSLAGMIIATADDAHLKIDAFVNIFSKKTQLIFIKANFLVFGLFSLLMVGLSGYYTWDVYDMEQYAIAVDIPIWVIVAGLPTAFFLNALFAFRKCFTMKQVTPEPIDLETD